MTVVAVASVKHSPGATTLAAALVTAWTGGGGDPANGPAVLVEADPAGGDLAARVGLAREPGLASLAASARHPGSAVDVAAHAQPLPFGGWLVPAPTSPDTADGAVRGVAARLAHALRGVGLGVVDCGRWAPDSAAGPVFGSSDLVLVVVRPDVAGVDHLCARLDALRRACGDRLAVAVIGDRPYDASTVAVVSGWPTVLAVADDPAGAAGLCGAYRPAAVRRSRLVRSARAFLDSIVDTPTQAVPA